MRVLLTGANGRLGRAVWRVLLEEGHDVVATDRGGGAGLPGPLAAWDLLDRSVAYRLLEGCDAVVHLANYPNLYSAPMPQIVYGENTSLNANVFQAATDLGVRHLIFASSVQACLKPAWGRSSDTDDDEPIELPYLPADGDYPANPRNLYGLSKTAGEAMLRYFAAMDATLSCVAIRFPGLWSQQHPKFQQWLAAEPKPSGWFGGRRPAAELFAMLTMEEAGRLIGAMLARPVPGYHQVMPVSAINSAKRPAAELIDEFYQGVELRKPRDQITSLVDTQGITERWGWVPDDLLAPAGQA